MISTYSFGAFELERRTFIVGNSIVFTARDDSEGSSGPKITAIDWSGLACNVTIGSTSIGKEYVTKLFSTFTDANNPLVIL